MANLRLPVLQEEAAPGAGSLGHDGKRRRPYPADVQGRWLRARRVFAMVRAKPAAHAEAFAWMLGTAALFYLSFGIFREQFCVVMCPYGRLQSMLLDDDALVVGYDGKRGAPRGKRNDPGASACVDCNRCVVVYPTGIDIREGLQLDCIACTACIDTCDEVLDRLERPRGLVRYDSLCILPGETRRILRPRVIASTVLLVAGWNDRVSA